MKILNKITNIVALLLIVVILFVILLPVPKAYAATSPTLTGASGYSVLGGAAVTNVGTTNLTGAIGVSPGTSITGGTINATGGTFIPPDSDAAQADRLSAFGALNAGTNADVNCMPGYGFGAGNVDLAGRNLVPGVYCADTFTLTGTLNLSGTTGVWVFKAATTLITSSASSVTGGDPCNVWWRIGSAATLGTTTSFLGNIVTDDDGDTTALGTGATLNGRVLGGTGQTVTLAGNTISLTCSAAPTSTPTPTSSSSSSSSSSSGGSGSTGGSSPCPNFTCVTPLIIESRRIDADSIFISWGPYAGISKFVVQYGFENGKWLYSTTVSGFSTTINFLPSNQPIWVLISPTDECSIGPCGVAKLVGGPSLPSTGIGQTEKSFPWNFLIGIFLISSSLYLIQRKHKFS